MKILIAYYSHSANTKKLAEIIAKVLKSEFQNAKFYYLTTKSKKIYTDRKFQTGDFFVFGPETRGIPESILNQNKDTSITIPMKDGQRSLNLSNSVAIVLYEAIRQNGL